MRLRMKSSQVEDFRRWLRLSATEIMSNKHPKRGRITILVIMQNYLILKTYLSTNFQSSCSIAKLSRRRLREDKSIDLRKMLVERKIGFRSCITRNYLLDSLLAYHFPRHQQQSKRRPVRGQLRRRILKVDAIYKTLTFTALPSPASFS